MFYSKRDIWLGLLLLTSTGIAAFATMFDEGVSFISLLMLVVFGFACWLWFGTYYLIEDGKLLVRSGPFRSTVEIVKIKCIKDTRNPLSAPALSLDRIELTGDGVYLLISPKMKTEFVNQLKEINENIVYECKS